MSCEKNENALQDVTQQVSINDAQIQKLAESHNLYLEEMVKTYDYNSKLSDVENFKANFLKANLDDISISEKTTIIERLKNTNKSTGESSLKAATIDNLISEINSADFPNKELLVELITIATNKVTSSQLTCVELTSFLDNIINDAITTLDEKERIVIKSYFETLKASAYFWFSVELGGSGIGYTHLQNLNDNNNKASKEMSPLGSALIADASSMSIGMIGVAVAGTFFGPIGWGALAIVAGESAANSGLAAVISAMQ